MVFAETGHLLRAAKAVGINSTTVWRRRKSDPEFRERYSEAQQQAGEILEATAIERARDGVKKLKFNPKTGEAYTDPETGKPYYETEYSDALMQTMLRALLPKKYGAKGTEDPRKMITLAEAEQRYKDACM